MPPSSSSSAHHYGSSFGEGSGGGGGGGGGGGAGSNIPTSWTVPDRMQTYDSRRREHGRGNTAGAAESGAAAASNADHVYQTLYFPSHDSKTCACFNSSQKPGSYLIDLF